MSVKTDIENEEDERAWRELTIAAFVRRCPHKDQCELDRENLRCDSSGCVLLDVMTT